MLTFFPEFYPDELLYSVFARYHVRSGNHTYAQTMQELFGDRGAHMTAVADFPSRLQHLCEEVLHFGLKPVEEWIYEHSHFLYFTVFTTGEIRKRIIEMMLQGASSGVSLFGLTGCGKTTIMEPTYFRYCPHCLQEDLEQRGETYWRTIHQLPSVLLCPEHETVLYDSSVPVKGTIRNYYVPVSWKVCQGKPVATITDDKTFQHLLRVAKRTKELLQFRPTYEKGKLTETYRSFLGAQGYLTSKGLLRQQKLRGDIISYYGEETLQLLQSAFPAGKKTWLKQLLVRKRSVSHPLHHLVLQEFLGVSVQELEDVPTAHHGFGAGPYPCLNPASNHYKELRIPEVKLEYDGRRGGTLGVFAVPAASRTRESRRRIPIRTTRFEHTERTGRKKYYGNEETGARSVKSEKCLVYIG